MTTVARQDRVSLGNVRIHQHDVRRKASPDERVRAERQPRPRRRAAKDREGEWTAQRHERASLLRFVVRLPNSTWTGAPQGVASPSVERVLVKATDFAGS